MKIHTKCDRGHEFLYEIPTPCNKPILFCKKCHRKIHMNIIIGNSMVKAEETGTEKAPNEPV